MMIAALQSSMNYKPNTVEKKRPLYKKNMIVRTNNTSNVRQRSSLSSSSSSSKTSSYITNPTDYDVLCIKDKTWARHIGNRIYRERVLTLASNYDNASKQEKMKITRSIVQLMQLKYHSRFLRQVNINQDQNDQSNDVWEIITDKQARDKTSHALRFAAKTTTTPTTTKTTFSPTRIQSSSTDSNSSDTTRTAASMITPMRTMSISNVHNGDDNYCEQSIVSTSSTCDHPTEQKRNHFQNENDNDVNDESGDEEEQEDEDDEEYREPIDESQQVSKAIDDKWKDDSFLMKCDTIVEINNPTNEVNTNRLSSSSEEQEYDTLYNKQQQRLLQSMQYQQYQNQYDNNNDDEDKSITVNHNDVSLCIPEKPVRALSFQRWTSLGSTSIGIGNDEAAMKSMRYGTNDTSTTNMFLDMSLSLDDIFSSYPYYDITPITTIGSTTLNTTTTNGSNDAIDVAGTAPLTSSFNPQDFDGLQLDF